MGQVIEDFKKRLEQFEKTGNTNELLKLFSADAICSALTRPHPHHAANTHSIRPVSSDESPERFWREYRAAFREIQSEFKRDLLSEKMEDGHATLEWESRGVLSNGMPIHYVGVTLLEFKKAKIVAMRTYFDSAALMPHGEHAHRNYSHSVGAPQITVSSGS